MVPPVETKDEEIKEETVDNEERKEESQPVESEENN